MGANAVLGTLLGLSIILITGETIPAQEPRLLEPPKAVAPKLEGVEETPAKAVSQLVEQIRQHPVKPSTGADRVGLYMIDLLTGEVTLVADQPEPGLTQCGSPMWSNDGKRIVYDATPGTQFNLTHLKSIELAEGRLVVTDLGAGNCPTFSPTGDRIAFLLNSGAVPNAESGVWIMKADGSERRLLGSYGVPKWSPYGGRQLMIISFSTPREVTLMDARPEKSGPLQITGHQVYAVPTWAGDGTIVAVIGSDAVGAGDTIALLDVREPGQGKVKEVLWKKGNDLDVKLTYPVYSPITRRCVFVRAEEKGMALFSVQQGQADPPKRLEPTGFDHLITGLTYSPDGRYILFSSDRIRTDRRQQGSAPGGRAPEGKDRPSGERRKTP